MASIYVSTDRARRMKNLLKAIETLTRRYKHPPTVRELGAHTGRNISNVHRDLRLLRAEGRVTWEENKPRTLRVVA